MKKLPLVLAVAAIVVPVAGAGGWATVGLSSLPPTGLEPGQAWPVDITVLQHGQTPLSGVTPVLRIRDDGGKVVGTFRGAPTTKAGVYRTVARFPAEGTYTYEVDDGFTRHGQAKAHTFEPVTIGPGERSFPYLPAGIATVAGLAAAALLLVRRTRRRPEPATVTNLKEAA